MSYAHTYKVLTTTSTKAVDAAILHSHYFNTINLAHAFYSHEKLTDHFTALLTNTKDLTNACDTTITDRNTVTSELR
jgi:hypothetical protein